MQRWNCNYIRLSPGRTSFFSLFADIVLFVGRRFAAFSSSDMNILAYHTQTNCVRAGLDTQKTPNTPNTPKTLNYAEHAVEPACPTFILVYPYGNMYSLIRPLYDAPLHRS